MPDAAIQPETMPHRPSFDARALLAWVGSGSVLKLLGSATGSARSKRHVVEPDETDTRTEPSDLGARSASIFPLLNAYAASALEIARHAAAAGPGLTVLSLGPVAVQALVGDVIRDIEPRARKAGLALLRDANSRCDGVCCADPAQLRRVLSHLLLRALSMEQAPGHVRVMVTLTSYEAQILILSRTPEAALAAHAAAACDDLVAPQRLLQAMGGSLVLEPRRAGYLPLCIALPALSAASALDAA